MKKNITIQTYKSDNFYKSSLRQCLRAIAFLASDHHRIRLLRVHPEGREKSRKLGESDLKPDQRAPVRRAPPTPSHCSRVHRGRRISRPRAPPFCNTLLYTLSLSHCGSLSATHRPLYETVKLRRPHSLPVCIAKQLGDNPQPSYGSRLGAPAASCQQPLLTKL